MAFQEFTGTEYLKIDIAGNFGYDKEDWGVRIAWFDKNKDNLHAMVAQADEPALFYAGILAWEKTQRGEPTGYPISLDATCSGIQILACLAGDRKAAEITNVVDTGHRRDAYVSIYQDMVRQLGDTAKIDRKQTKNAIMTAFYSSTRIPKQIFGEGELLKIFFDTVKAQAPGAWEISETMLAIWDNDALENSWVLPDNYHVNIKVMGKVTESVNFLNQPFDVTFEVNKPIKKGRSLGANMNHSVDGMVVREMQRRCDYNPKTIERLKLMIEAGCAGRSTRQAGDILVQKLWKHYQDSGFLSARILEYLTIDNIGLVNPVVIGNLIASLPKKPFEFISVHDCFRCLPNYGNDLRRQYNNLLALIAESELLRFIVSQILGRVITTSKLDPSLAADIRNANYALS